MQMQGDQVVQPDIVDDEIDDEVYTTTLQLQYKY